jgi:hypothetical protein
VSSPYGQPQPYNQPPPYGHPQPQYGQPQYGQPMGYGQPGYPPGKKSPMPWILAGGGVVVVAVVVVLIIVLTGGADKSDPKSVAQAAVDAYNDQSVDGIKDVSCSATKQDIEEELGATGLGGGTDAPSGDQLEVSAELGEVKTSGDTATADIKLVATKVPESMKEYVKEGQSTTETLNLKKENGDWCVSGFGGSAS